MIQVGLFESDFRVLKLLSNVEACTRIRSGKNVGDVFYANWKIEYIVVGRFGLKITSGTNPPWIDWCIENCSGNFSIEETTRKNYIYFEKFDDAAVFHLAFI